MFPPQKIRKVHFVGIGGIGVSALARWYHAQKWLVSGSDIESSEITDALKNEGILITIGAHKAQNVPLNAKLLIYTAAAKKNPEIEEARRRKIKIQSYAEALGDITKKYLTIAVAGSHGKSTTTALISLILTKAEFDPTVIIGTKLREFANPHAWRDLWLSPENRSFGSNFKSGSSPILVIEADEWNRSFWNYTPTLTVLTNVDKEHLDSYKTEAGVQRAFKKFLLRTRPGGRIVVNTDDKPARDLTDALKKKYPSRFKQHIHPYSVSENTVPEIRAAVRLPGKHGASNALAAYTVAKILNIPDEVTKEVLSEFEGAWRRFEHIGVLNGSPVIADYAHHPTEVKKTLEAARTRFGKKKLIAVFQPHQLERTRALFPEFQTAFDGADIICFTDIYEVAGRERKSRNSKTSAFKLAQSLAKNGIDARYIPYPSKLKEFLTAEAGINSVILMLGAGSIWNIGKKIVQ